MDKFWKITKFTVVQQVKGKAFKISTTIILAAVLILSSLVNIIPAIKADKGSKESEAQSEEKSAAFSKIYYLNEAKINADIEGAVKTIFPEVEFENANESLDDLIEKLSSSEAAEVLLDVAKSDEGYNVRVVTAAKCKESLSDDSETLGQLVVSAVENTLLIDNGVSPDKIQEVRTPVNNEVVVAGEKDKTIEERIVEMIFPMVVCIILFYIIYFYGYWVASSIVAEKTSRIMELLLTSTTPLELVTGKCAGMGFLAITQFAAIAIMALLGVQGGGYIAGHFINENAKIFSTASVFSSIPSYKLLIVILFFVLGYILYAVFNALVGATVSRLEDLNTALMPVSFVSVISFYLSYMALMTEGGTIAKVATYVPFSSPFYVPATILSDSVSGTQMVIALLILVAAIAVFILFTAKVYAVVILHTGNRLRFKDMFKIYKTEK